MNKKDAIKHFGNAANLAKALNVSRQAITLWGDTVPLLRQYQLQELTNGELKARPPNNLRSPAPGSQTQENKTSATSIV